MAYYMGDYYMGDYYKGDPFLGGLIGGLGGWIGKKLFGRGAKKAGSAIARRTTGAIARPSITGGLSGLAGSALGHMFTGSRLKPEYRAMMQMPGALQRVPGIQGTLQRILPGGATGYECPEGYYAQRKDGEYTGRCLRRRMNVGNSTALRRSLRRVAGFGKLACRTRTDVGRAARAVGAGSVSRRRSCPPRRKCG